MESSLWLIPLQDYAIMLNLAAALEKEGISVFRFDFSGNGESEGSFEYGSYYRGVDDLHAVIRHFSGENRVVSAILGHSKGGDVVLLYASKYRDIRIVVNVSGRCDTKRNLAERFGEDFMEKIKKEGYIDVKMGPFEFRLTEEELMDHLNMNMREHCRKIDTECRVMTVHGSADDLVPVEDASEFDEIVPNHQLKIIEGADHGYTAHQTELASAVVKFIKSALEEGKVRIRFISSANRRICKPNSTTLRMAHSHSAQNPVIEQRRVIIPNKHGEKLVGLLHEAKSKEIVVLCHGFRSRKDYNTMTNLAAALEKEGISVFRFDFAGNGESEGSFQYGNYYREADDLHAVIQHFSGENRVVSAILGHSKGGNVVLLYASKYQDIRMVINVSGRYDLKRGIAERLGEEFMETIKKDGYIDVKNNTGGVEYRVTEEALMDRLGTDMREACLKIDKECRVLTVHGSADEIIPLEDALEFAKIIPNHQIHIIEGANHGYTLHQTELASAVVKFINSVLEQDKVAPK
ncbi:hypothetical protein like AT3G47590 [Hibiscus trionum]|uniref:Serine aminopeptidase S33 domain-containing protein n=1 Tax=Hibiscus trionum TaxID=183268 RepID=A0A9W7MJU0_HIBTR|nr:hypothetical protein like AT3G47590 [Hibiscus trionum]